MKIRRIERYDKMRIIVDAMGGDNAPHEIVKGCVDAAAAFDVELVLVGRQAELEKELNACGKGDARITIHNADEVISGEDDPISAIRSKKNSSMRIGLSLTAEGKGDAFVSAGNTGALISGATLVVKRIPGIRRAALAPVMPSAKGNFLMIDAGANAECTPAFLKQFAIMGSVYMQRFMDMDSPRVGLINIGTEEDKGTDLIRETHAQLKELPINYTGYIEAREVPLGGADVVVCDGFTGNVMLKFMEGMAGAFSSMLKGVFYKNTLTKLSALMVKGGLVDMKKSMDYKEHGGAPVLGVKAPVIKAHGSSDAKAFFNAVRQAKRLVECRLIENITDGIAQYGCDEKKNV